MFTFDKIVDFAIVFVFLLIVVCVVFIMSGSFDDAKKQQAYYCEMVQAKAWPDYKQNYEKVCK